MRLVGDAGETGIGVYSPGGELPHPIVATWTEEQVQLMQSEPMEFSSTLRELWPYRWKWGASRRMPASGLALSIGGSSMRATARQWQRASIAWEAISGSLQQ